MFQDSYDIDSDSEEEEENAQTNKEYPLVQDIQSVNYLPFYYISKFYPPFFMT
jgi:hypothetical protein